MSIHVISWVLQHSPAEHSERLVLIVLADHAQPDGTSSYPAHETIMREARLGARSTVQRSLDKLEAAGHIRRTGRHPKGMVIYQVMMDNVDAFYRVDGGASGVLAVSPEQGGPQNEAPDPAAPDSEGAQSEMRHEPSLGTVPQKELSQEDGSKDGSCPAPDAPALAAWQRIREQLEQKLPEIRFYNFIEPLTLVSIAGAAVVVAAPPHIGASVKERYLSKILAAARAELGDTATVEVRITSEEAA